MKTKVEYECPTCKATKTIIHDSERVGHSATIDDFPKTIVCGWRGCQDYAIPLPIPRVSST